jgi:hypothetical protein
MRTSPTRKRTAAFKPEIVTLSPAEQQDLLRIESRIDSGLAAFFDVAYALLEIKQRRLYRAWFTNFDQYCRERWDMHRAYAYRLIGAAQICTKLSPMGDIPLPENERQIRPLTGLPEKTAEEAWKRACEKAGSPGKITGALVQQAVEEVVRIRSRAKSPSPKLDWQIRIIPLLEQALALAKRGNREEAAELIDKIALLFLVGRRETALEAEQL